jgi:hypothetical protein
MSAPGTSAPATQAVRLAPRRLRALGAVSLVLLSLLVAVVIDGRIRHARGEAAMRRMERVAEVTGLTELALSTTSGWLRNPGLAAPAAATADAPIGMDVDPAGAAITPPRARRAR